MEEQTCNLPPKTYNIVPMKTLNYLLRCLLCLFLLVGVDTYSLAGEIPVLTDDASNPVLYRIKNTRRTAKGTANYWTTTGLSTKQSDATEVYFTGTQSGKVQCVKIHLKDTDQTLTADFKWGEGIDWYVKEFLSAQGGGYRGVLISNSNTFPNVTGDKMADDGLGCWYVGSSNAAAWLYGGQWDGSIFTLEIEDPSRLPEEPTETGPIVNASFETGDLTGWVYGSIGGDHFVKPISDEVFATSGGHGDYIFNTWYSSDSYVADTQNQCVYQTIKDMPVGEYSLSACVSSNAYSGPNTPVTLFANDFAIDFVPQHKSSFEVFSLEKIFITEDVRSLTVGLRSASWFRADDFQLVSLGETDAFKEYVENKYADASLGHPVLFDAFDGQTTNAFTYTEIGGHTHGGYPLSTGGVQNDQTMVDRSLMQVWTANEYQLGNSTTSVSYQNLPDGYYRISSTVRVYDLNGDYDGSASGLSLYANEAETFITNGTTITKGDASGKGFWGEYSVLTKVENGKLEAGFRLNNATFNWLGWQNFRVEYIGVNNPTATLLNLNLPAETYVPICLPYALKPEYFGDLYTVAEVKDGVATLIPVSSVALGEPCVVYANGSNPNVSIDDLKVNFDTPARKLTLWDNVVMQGDYDTHSWTAEQVDATKVDVASLTFKVADLSAMNFTASQENRAAAAFWARNPKYSASSTSVIEKFLNEPTVARRDQPHPVQIPVVARSTSQKLQYSTKQDMSDALSVTIPAKQTIVQLYNLMPGLTYYYKTADGKSAGQFTVGGTLRMLYVGDNSYNVRDLGGKKVADGRYVKYGKLFRSGEFNGGYVATDAELQTMRNLGVGAEIDLRNFDNSGVGISPFGFTVEEGNYYSVGGDHYIGDGPGTINDAEAKLHWKNEFKLVLNNLRQARGVDFHCRIGADRTGIFAFLLEGLLGVSEADLLRDYETTSFSTAAGVRTKTQYGYNDLMKNTFTGSTATALRNSFNSYFINKLGIKQSEINEFRNLMLDEDPCADADLISQLSSIEVLRTAIKSSKKYEIGEGPSQYTCSKASAQQKLQEAIADAEAYIAAQQYDRATTEAHTEAVNAAAKAFVAALKLNMPKAGQYMYLKSASYGSYISIQTEPDDHGYIRFPMVSTPDELCVFHYDGKRFLNYKTGLAFSTDPIEYGNGIGDRSNMTAVDPTKASTITVKASSKGTIAAYNLYTSKAVLLTKAVGNNLDGFSDWLQHTDEDIIMVQVAEPGTDGIIDTRYIDNSTLPVFDLLGRPVTNCHSRRGIYLRNGHKYIVK